MKVIIPGYIYQSLLEHLTINAPADAWAKMLLEQLDREAKPTNKSLKKKLSDNLCVRIPRES